MLPSNLIAVRRYPLPELAANDQQLLTNAGIAAYVKRLSRPATGAALMVAESDVDAALSILSDAPNLTEVSRADPALICPHCGSSAVSPRPPFALLGLVVGGAGTAALKFYGQPGLAIWLGLLTALGSSVAFGYAARWRCTSCGRRYGAGTAGDQRSSLCSNVPVVFASQGPPRK